MSSTSESKGTVSPGADHWPLEVRCALQALGRPVPVARERRARDRKEQRLCAKLRILSHSPNQPIVVYLRDLVDNAVSFVCESHLKLNEIVELEVTLEDGTARKVRCRVGRCRQFQNGWFEGVLYRVA